MTRSVPGRARGSAAPATVALLVALAAVVCPADARADEDIVWDEDEPEPIYIARLRVPPRKIIGFDFGLGIFDALCDRCLISGGISLDVFAGVQITHRLAFVADFWSLLHLLPSDSADERGLSAHSLASVATRVWLAPEVWAQAGVGVGFLSVVGPQDETEAGPAATLAVGRELKHRPFTGIDISARLGFSSLQFEGGREIVYSAAAAVGYHWN